MLMRLKSWGALCAVPLAVAALVTVAEAKPDKVDNPQILPPGPSHYGKTYAEWSAAWWQWAYGLPQPGHPLFDETGSECGRGQSGPVWFLGGAFNVATATRDLCDVPSDKALFFPILNVEWDNVCPPGNLTVEELRAVAASFADAADRLAVEVDGRIIHRNNMEKYRTVSPVFSVTFPDDNLFQFFGCDTPPGTYSPFVGDGFYIMLAPLEPGPHTIHFHGRFSNVGFELDITYHLNVVEAGTEAAAATIPGGGAASSTGIARGTLPAWHIAPGRAAPINVPTWGQLKIRYR